MSFITKPPFLFTLLFIVLLSDAAMFTIRNNCPITLWPAAIPGGGRRLDFGQTWTLSISSNNTNGRIWARTGCSFNRDGRGRCQTGDCNGLLECQAFGSAPNTLAEFGLGEINDVDFFDISVVDGFNVPMEFSPNNSNCRRRIMCVADINGQCPNELRAAGGCHNPCTVFGTTQYCCNGTTNCEPTDYSRFFKERCRDAFSYPRDDTTSTFTCPRGTNYRVVFCP
ncbi:hypothetical protein CASFOL_018246 [Castilleja foliolosa]|uniref:Thaumatin-like protein n=1 Tax=Castilleja foliolosa TaxID=1961234 RepID=A0ABD3D663_9LAMI